jgi:hypothetical protein
VMSASFSRPGCYSFCSAIALRKECLPVLLGKQKEGQISAPHILLYV